jgi:pathogenesis-related protein 1
MARRAVIGIVLMLCACGGDDGNLLGDAGGGGSGDASGGGTGEPADLAGITADHNTVRATLNEPPLTWDPQLATIASTYAAMCIDANGDGLVDHNPNRSSGYPEYVGENIYASTGTATAADAVDDWVSESASYDHATNTCATGQVCGHYTQVVWKATTKLGCALQDCPSLRYGSTILCDYAPGGNIDGQSPY